MDVHAVQLMTVAGPAIPQLVMYEPSRPDAQELANRFAKYARAEVRSTKVLNALDAIDKGFEAFDQRVEKKMDAFEKRVSARHPRLSPATLYMWPGAVRH